MRGKSWQLIGCRVFLVLVLLPYAVAVAGQDATPVLDWQVLLADPDPEELTNLARQYEHAIGYRRDYGRARQLYCAAARLSYLPAQLRLAWMYANGLGAPRDTDLAATWLQVAAASGDLQARKFLAYVGEPGVRREPRCTYESRFDAYAIATIPGQDWVSGVNTGTPERKQIASWVRLLAPDYGLDPNLILAIIQTESNFNPRARSPMNAQGLMQLIPETAARFGVRDTADPVQNLHGGMAYMRWLLSFFQGDLRLSLAGYNAGERTVEKYLGVPPYQETQNYIRKVIRAYGRDTHPPIELVVEPSRIIRSSQKER
ncbi:MAG: transglycosylase SLT domain-containing protein [Gammaproteobacteria bacterium]|nr:transglycosylase SLT domain-containing protein [Gammaproteobacteria bacterium]